MRLLYWNANLTASRSSSEPVVKAKGIKINFTFQCYRSNKFHLNRWKTQTHCPTAWQTGGQTDGLPDWLPNCLTNGPTQTNRRQTNWLTDIRTDRLTDWLTDWSTTWPADWWIDWLTDWLTDWLNDGRMNRQTDTDECKERNEDMIDHMPKRFTIRIFIIVSDILSFLGARCPSANRISNIVLVHASGFHWAIFFDIPVHCITINFSKDKTCVVG